MATKKKAAAKKAAAKATPASPPTPKVYVKRPVRYTTVPVTEDISEDVLQPFGARRVLHAQTATFAGVEIPGQPRRAQAGDVILVGDDNTITVCSQLELAEWYEAI